MVTSGARVGSAPLSETRDELPSWAQAQRVAGGVDFAAIAIQNKSSGRSLFLIPSITVRAFQIVWRAGRWVTAFSMSLVFANAALTVAQVLAAKWVLTTVLDGGSHPRVSALWPSVVVLASLSATSLILRSTSAQLRRLLTQMVGRETGREILEVATTLPLTAYEHPGFFDHLQRVESNALTRPSDIVNGVAVLLSSLTTAVGLAGVIATTEPIILPILVVAAVPTYVANRFASRVEFAFVVEQTPRLRERDYLRMLLKSRDAAKEVRAYGAGKPLQRRWDERSGEYIDAFKAVIRRRVTYSVVGAVVSSAVLAGTLLLLGARVTEGESLTRVATALVAIRMLLTQMQGTAGGLNGLFESRLFLEDYEKFLSYKPASPDAASAAPIDPFRQLQLLDVSFTYPGASHPSLEDISFDLAAGEVVALVGENGSGKTTLAKLLADLYTPTSGRMRWNGIDTDQVHRETIRSQVGVIFQDYLKYALSVTDNVALGRPEDDSDSARVRAAAERAGAAAFIEQLPEGYETRLGKLWADSADLSVGQWQRLALARMFYRDAQLIILDEPTSALDPRAEAEFFSRLRTLFAGRTIVLISHRFSTVRSADRIMVLERGRIVQRGTHDDLMAEGGLYSELFTLQAQAFLDPIHG